MEQYMELSGRKAYHVLTNCLFLYGYAVEAVSSLFQIHVFSVQSTKSSNADMVHNCGQLL
jgi:hypothetical protein